MRRQKKYKSKFERFHLNNRWKTPIYSRSGDWVMIGIGIRFFSPTEYEYYINCFGIDFRFWFVREWIG